MVFINHQYENVSDTFNFSKNTFVPSGQYGFNQFETHLSSPHTNKFVLGIDFIGGSFYDGSIISIGASPSWNVGSAFQLGLTYNHNLVKFNNRNQTFRGGITGFKASVMLSTKLSLSTFIQYNSAENNVMTNFRFRYNPREGNDFYIVLNEGRNTYRDVENPRLPLYNNRSLRLKYTYTLSL